MDISRWEMWIIGAGGMDISRWEMWNIGEGEWTSAQSFDLTP